MNLLPVLRLEVVTVLGDKGQQGVELQILHLPNDLLADMAKGLRLLLHGHACGFENILDVFGLKFHHDLPLGLERFGTDGRAQEGAHDAYQKGVALCQCGVQRLDLEQAGPAGQVKHHRQDNTDDG